MAAKGSRTVIYAALAGNTLIAVTKFIAAFHTGSSAMFSEAIHSLVDTGNQGLLLHGMGRASRKADTAHPFGYGREIYFWAFVVAILIFAVGAGVSIYEGVQKFLDPHPVTNPLVNYVVLGLAMMFEGAAWTIAFKEFNATRRKRSILEEVRSTKDPSIVTILLEDTAAMLGLLVALAGIMASSLFGIPEFDGAASIVIGCILATAAVVLAYETKGLLIGEAAHPEVVARVKRMIAADTRVLSVNEILTMHLGSDDVLMTLSLDFRDDIDAGAVESSISELEARIKARFPSVGKVFIEAQSYKAHIRSQRTGVSLH